MEPQEAFDTMVAHLRKQGVRSKVSEGAKCLYRSDMGLKCAVGCLIPDVDYIVAMEETGIFSCFPVFREWPEATLLVMRDMQDVHDSSYEWEAAFAYVAQNRDLTLKPKTKTP